MLEACSGSAPDYLVLQTSTWLSGSHAVLAPLDGVEPPPADSESAVLPLDERGILVRVGGVEPPLQASEACRLPQSFTLLNGDPSVTRTPILGFVDLRSVQLS